MPQPLKESMYYFSHDSNARGDRKLKLYLANTGLAGIGFWWSILEDIYNNSYFLPWTEEDAVLFASEFTCSQYPVITEDINYFVEQAFKWDLLYEEVYNSYSVLTSPSLQRRYLKQASRRLLVEMVDEYTLIDIEEFYEKELKTAKLSVKMVDLDGNVLDILGDYEQPANGKKKSKQTPKPTNGQKKPSYDSKYDFDCSEPWDGDQPIDYAGCVDTWNKINGSQSRVTESKRTDLRRVFRNYTGIECLHAMIIRSKDERLQESKYLTQWSTLFGAKKLENLDKWVDAGREWLDNQSKLETIDDHKQQGWVSQKTYQDICDRQGIEFEDPTFCEVKKVEQQLLYYPKFTY